VRGALGARQSFAGLKLLVRDDSGALVRRIAQEIHEQHGVWKS
jgi:hypothetical protein